MKGLFASLALSAVMAGSAFAQTPKFITVDIVGKSLLKHHNEDGPSEIHVRVPVSLAKSFLEMANDKDNTIKINGKASKGMKTDQLVQLLENAKAGDLLLELTTDKGDVVKISVQ